MPCAGSAAACPALCRARGPSAFDVGRGKRLAVMPFDALAQLEGQTGVIRVPRPTFRQFRLDELRPVYLFVLLETDQAVEHRRERRHRRDRRLLVDRAAGRAVAMKEFERPAALLRRRRAGCCRRYETSHRRERGDSAPHFFLPVRWVEGSTPPIARQLPTVAIATANPIFPAWISTSPTSSAHSRTPPATSPATSGSLTRPAGTSARNSRRRHCARPPRSASPASMSARNSAAAACRGSTRR